jgi:hypothetical protein
MPLRVVNNQAGHRPGPGQSCLIGRVLLPADKQHAAGHARDRRVATSGAILSWTKAQLGHRCAALAGRYGLAADGCLRSAGQGFTGGIPYTTKPEICLVWSNGLMKHGRNSLVSQLNRWILYIFALAGLIAGAVGTLISLPWVHKNIQSILLFELSVLLAFLLTELGPIRDYIRDARNPAGDVRTFDTPGPLYRAAATALEETAEFPHANKSVWVTSATGVPDIRPPLEFNPPVRDYYRALAAVINRPGWSVRIIYHINSLERLEWVHDYLANMRNAFDLEARVIVHATQELLAPLIVGDDHVFLAEGDRRFFAVQAGIWIRQPSANYFARGYFDSLWQSQDLKVLRRATGLNEETFEAIRQELSEQVPGDSQV